LATERIAAQSTNYSLHDFAAWPTMPAPDGLIGITQRLPVLIVLEAENALAAGHGLKKQACARNQAEPF